MKYPKIERRTIDFTSDTEVCNIGYCEGILEDQRPYRLEIWTSYGTIMATIFLSIIGFENKSEEEIKKYISDNKLIRIIEDDIYITELEDSNDNSFLSINVPLRERDKVINEYLVEIHDFEVGE